MSSATLLDYSTCSIRPSAVPGCPSAPSANGATDELLKLYDKSGSLIGYLDRLQSCGDSRVQRIAQRIRRCPQLKRRFPSAEASVQASDRKRCKSWLCPACAERQRQTTYARMVGALRRHLASGFGVYSLVLTVRRSETDSACDLLAILNKGWQVLWRRLKRQAKPSDATNFRVVQFGRGANVHLHVLVALPGGASLTEESLRKSWHAITAALGRPSDQVSLARLRSQEEIEAGASYATRAEHVADVSDRNLVGLAAAFEGRRLHNSSRNVSVRTTRQEFRRRKAREVRALHRPPTNSVFPRSRLLGRSNEVQLAALPAAQCGPPNSDAGFVGEVLRLSAPRPPPSGIHAPWLAVSATRLE